MPSRRTPTFLLALAAILILAAGAAADAEFLVVQKLPGRPYNSDNDGEAHIAAHSAEVLKAVRAAFVEKAAPQAATFVDSGPDPTLRRQNDNKSTSKRGGNRRMLAAREPVVVSPQHLMPRASTAFPDTVGQVEGQSQHASYHATLAVRSAFMRPINAVRIALSKSNGER